MYKKFLRPYIEKTTQFNNEPKALHQRNYLDEKPAHEVMFNIFIKTQIKTMVRYYYTSITMPSMKITNYEILTRMRGY